MKYWSTHRSGTAHMFWSSDIRDDGSLSACGRVTAAETDKELPTIKQCKSCKNGVGGRRHWQED